MKKTYQSPYAKVIEIHFNQGILNGSVVNNEKGYDEEFTRRRMWMEDEEDEW